MAECEKFSDATDIFEWASVVRDSLGFEDEALAQCRATICVAIWGTGNPDISGIGVVVAYLVEIIGAVILSVALWALHRFGHRFHSVRREIEKPVIQGMSTFYDSAVFFTLAIQIASTVVLAKKDYLVDTAGFGVLQAQITWNISIACILPLMYPISMMDMWTRDPPSTVHHPKDHEHGVASPSPSTGRARRNYTLTLYCLVFALFIYPLQSQLVNNWKPSDIGEGKAPDGKPDITAAEYGSLFDLCFRDSQPLSSVEDKILAAFEAAASGAVVLFSVWTLLSAAFASQDRAERWEKTLVVKTAVRAHRSAKDLWERLRPSWYSPIMVEVILLALPMMFAAPLLWGIFRIRNAQQALADATENAYEDNEWTFGQVVAIVMFSPVVADMVYSWWYDVLK